MKATLLHREKFVYADGAIREMVLWRLPSPDPERPHGLKYSLYYGKDGKRLIGYDNERGKGDHRHYAESEEIYAFESVEKLVQDLADGIEKVRGREE